MIAIKIQGVMKGYFSQVKGAEGDGGGEDREGGGHLLALFFFFFFFCGLLSQTSRSIPNEAGVGPEIFKY